MASRDFLRVFGAGGEGSGAPAYAANAADVELSLGLSLGGRFGTDAGAKRPRLPRSSSIASVCSLHGDGDADADADPSPAAPLPLLRTTSLPTETEEEHWRRREIQSRRRREARRKRVERRNSMGSLVPAGPKPAAAVDATAAIGSGRRSIGSQGSNSVSTTEQGIGGSAINQSTDSSPSTSDNTNKNNMLPPTKAAEKPLNGTVTEQPRLRTLGSLTTRTSSTSDIRKLMMEDMPMVSSKVEGPNTRRIDGFLYRYKKGEDVRIVCVCHGSFLTPAEFVKHAGGGDVSNPLRHIVVNPAPFS
ncbi:ninja-family protein 6-like [Miscanthus floridulus]|uniref:ninja-family protein 6-like n=1 Tax=Miscanthus floridulus TaxID=154761 RepID=UPI00345B10BF